MLSDGSNTTASPRHTHASADVRVVTSETHFDVHSQVLAIYSEYFRALFEGPWAATIWQGGQLRLVKPGDIVTTTDFELFLDYIYQHAKGEELTISADNVVELEAIAERGNAVAESY
ncbi:hypothetical protein BDZ88DRAFT_505153 [Geranomyces variabilis]|nr:hypothetical protein BDZ88DRAFT_505153 [Geranomyces variabilis]